MGYRISTPRNIMLEEAKLINLKERAMLFAKKPNSQDNGVKRLSKIKSEK